ncbi:MAG TPA: GNAT family N-acetyltransferase [Acidimicrobiales bacterium]
MIVRRERPGDTTAARTVQVAAFATAATDAEEPIEAGLLDELRRDDGWIPELSLVAEVEGEVVGHVVCTRATVGADRRPALGLGPIGVVPEHHGNGIGSALVHAVVAVAEALDETLVALLGDPAFYGALGFGPAADVGVEAPDPSWGVAFQVRVLDPSAVVAGPFVYAEPFARL